MNQHWSAFFTDDFDAFFDGFVRLDKIGSIDGSGFDAVETLHILCDILRSDFVCAGRNIPFVVLNQI
ncbi:hypothetical protein D3C86_1735800 [compost metagenome]